MDLVYTAYDKADEYRMPAMILADGMLGQMMEPVEFPEKEANHQIEKPWATTGHQNKRPHNIVNSLYLDPNELEQKVVERFKRYEIIKEKEPMAEEYLVDDADIVLVSFGATARIVKSAVNSARSDGNQSRYDSSDYPVAVPGKSNAEGCKNRFLFPECGNEHGPDG